MSVCKECGGLIMEQGKCYGYAGKVCNCQPPRYVTHPMFIPQPDINTELTRLRQQVEVLKGAVVYVSDRNWTASTPQAGSWINEFCDVANKALAAADRIAKVQQ